MTYGGVKCFKKLLFPTLLLGSIILPCESAAMAAPNGAVGEALVKRRFENEK